MRREGQRDRGSSVQPASRPSSPILMGLLRLKGLHVSYKTQRLWIRKKDEMSQPGVTMTTDCAPLCLAKHPPFVFQFVDP